MAAKTTEIIPIQPLDLKSVKIRITGDTPIIFHAWSAKAKREMLIKQFGFPKTKGREAKNPVDDFASSLYWLTEMPSELTEEAVSESIKTAKFGFPVTAFKQSAITAAYRLGWSKDKTSLRSAFFIQPEFNGYFAGDLVADFNKKVIDIVPNAWHSEGMAWIHGDAPDIREDMVKLGGIGNPADIRYRGQIDNWWCDLTITYNASGQVGIDQIVNIFNAGGFACGVGEWRPERDGQFGMYHVEA